MAKAGKVNILLVEDDEVDQMAMKRAFEKLRIDNPLVVAGDGVEALDYLHSINGGEIRRPYLIILDLNMPRMSGHEFLKEIRADQNLRNSVVFVLSTSKDLSDVVSSYDLNVAGYIVKGNTGESFMEVVEMMEHYWRIVELPN